GIVSGATVASNSIIRGQPAAEQGPRGLSRRAPRPRLDGGTGTPNNASDDLPPSAGRRPRAGARPRFSRRRRRLPALKAPGARARGATVPHGPPGGGRDGPPARRADLLRARRPRARARLEREA